MKRFNLYNWDKFDSELCTEIISTLRNEDVIIALEDPCEDELEISSDGVVIKRIRWFRDTKEVPKEDRFLKITYIDDEDDYRGEYTLDFRPYKFKVLKTFMDSTDSLYVEILLKQKFTIPLFTIDRD